MRSLGIPAGFFYLAILYGLAGFLVFNARAFGLCWVDFLDASNRPMPRHNSPNHLLNDPGGR
jgi:hypothetical protein